MSIMDLNEQELFRRESLAKLRELGIEPYPAPLYPINTSAAQVKAETVLVSAISEVEIR